MENQNQQDHELLVKDLIEGSNMKEIKCPRGHELEVEGTEKFENDDISYYGYCPKCDKEYTIVHKQKYDKPMSRIIGRR